MQALDSYSRAHDDAGAIREARAEAGEALLLEHADEWRRWFLARTAAGDLACDLPECDGDAWEAVASLVRSGLQKPWSSDDRKCAEEVVTALAQVAADREVLG
jgi:photosystem II stability/assembly factor-like uncharacterized protein